jgi:hypothetical protein
MCSIHSAVWHCWSGYKQSVVDVDTLQSRVIRPTRSLSRREQLLENSAVAEPVTSTRRYGSRSLESTPYSGPAFLAPCWLKACAHACAVARLPTDDYPARVHRPFLQRWVVMILLVTRLVLGDFVHAHDGIGDHAAAAADVADPSHCLDHAKHPGNPSQSDTNHSDSGTSTPDCCKAAKCACPCLHTPAVASVSSPTLAHMTGSRAVALAFGDTPNRPFKLFRPPA